MVFFTGIGIFEYWWSRVKGQYFGKRSVNRLTCQSGIVAPRDLGILRNKSIYFVFFCLFYLCFVVCSKFFILVMPIKIL